MKRFQLFISLMIIFSLSSKAQLVKDKGTFVQFKPGYYQNYILKGIEDFESQKKESKPHLSFKADIAGLNNPVAISDFTSFWHNLSISQGNAGTCWCFSTTSFFESEVYRLTKQKIKISEIYTVYWEYVEKARRFVKERGESEFGEGSEANAVTRIWKQYGVVPQSAYPGLLSGQVYHSHEKMFNEMNNYLKSVKANSCWNETLVLETIKSIMNQYIGVPPTSVVVDNKTISPKQYLVDVLKLKMDDYIDVLSVLEQPYWKQVEYTVPDNWWHSEDYFNVPLDDYMAIVRKSLQKGYTIGIGGDVSEAGFVASSNIAFIPSFDIPTEYIDENAREFRFSNKTTTDDHGMHVVGYVEKDGKYWYLVKDSSSGSRFGGKDDNKLFGYYLFREEYIKLKMMDFIVHKDMFADYIGKFVK